MRKKKTNSLNKKVRKGEEVEIDEKKSDYEDQINFHCGQRW